MQIGPQFWKGVKKFARIPGGWKRESANPFESGNGVGAHTADEFGVGIRLYLSPSYTDTRLLVREKSYRVQGAECGSVIKRGMACSNIR